MQSETFFHLNMPDENDDSSNLPADRQVMPRKINRIVTG